MSVFTPKSVGVTFTYEANPLLESVDVGANAFLVQRLTVSIEPDEEADDGIYTDVRTWGRKLTKSGEIDQRSSFGAVFVRLADTQPWVDDAKARYAKLVVLAS
jgi:hypothetical protein